MRVSATVVKSDIIPQVWSIHFEGNKTYDGSVLEQHIATTAPGFFEKLKFWKRGGHKFSETEVKKDVIRIRNYYRRRGFVHVEVSYRVEQGNKKWKKKVYFIIDENAAIRIQKVDFDFHNDHSDYIRNSSAFKNAVKKQAYRPGKRYEKIREPEVAGLFEDALENLGFAYAKVSVKARIDTARLAADLTIECEPGPIAYIDSIKVEGEKTVSKAYTIRESGLKLGERYSLKKIQDAQQELFNFHLFRFATISIPDQKQDSSLTLQLRVRENPLRSVQAMVGFGTEAYAGGQLSWVHRNAFGEGHKFTVTGRASFIQQGLNMDYLFPYIFNTRSSIVISPFGQHLLEKSFELLRGGITNSFIYRYNEHLTGSASYQVTKNRELSVQSEASMPDTTRTYDLSSLQLTSYYSEREQQEQRGWVIQPYFELSGFLNFATFRFQKATIDIRKYTRIGPTTIFAARVNMGGFFNVSTDSLPNNIRYYLGGTNSVRGWTRQELGPKRALIRRDSVRQSNGTYADTTRFVRYVPEGGRTMFSFNIELRQDISKLIKNVGLAAFLDGGQIWRKKVDLDSRPIQFGVGGGIRYQSPLGPLRIDIAYKLNPSKKDLNIYQGTNYGSAWDHIGIHFSIGRAF